LLFWSFFEQAGSSLNNFTDRNVDRVTEARPIVAADVGKSVELRLLPDPSNPQQAKLPLLTQEYLGEVNGDPGFKARIERAIREEEKRKGRHTPKEIDKLVAEVLKGNELNFSAFTYLREAAKADDARPQDQVITWKFTKSDIGMGFGGSEVPASVFQAVNPIYILIFGLVFTALWGFLGKRGLEPSTPVKFAFGLLQLGLGYGCIWFGATSCDARGMVAAYWLLLMYLLQTTGELCLSPVGLSMVTKLSPTRLVSTVMGTWFLATAFSQLLAAMFAQFAAVEEGGVIPVPKQTVTLYGDLYQMIALMALASGVFCLLLSPLLKYWMHVGEPAGK
jgi:POT family proton-dependent oligopeptide transporter